MPVSCIRIVSRIGLLLGLTISSGALGSEASVCELKAASFYNVAKFIEWPATALVGRSSFALCVSEPDSLGESLSRFVGNKTVFGRPISIRTLKAGDDLSGCHALFISARPVRKIAAVLRSVHGMPILTVGDTVEFLETGGMIALPISDGRLQLQIRAEQLRAAGLYVDPQLLRLAQMPKGRN